MFPFYFKQQLLYRLSAKTRHGVHSPFVFDFIETLLKKEWKGYKYPHLQYPPLLSLPPRHQKLVFNMVQYYGHDDIITLDDNGKAITLCQLPPALSSTNNEDRFIISPTEQAGKYFDNMLYSLAPGSIIVLTGMYDNEANKAMWDSLSQNKKVTLSLDLFAVGILFFRNDFLVKQHFILRF